MKILNISSTIKKWEQTSTNYTGDTLDGEKQGFLLLRNHPEHKTLFKITGDIYITDKGTDFILDIIIESVIQMEIDGVKPTLDELYEAYKAAHKDWNLKIVTESLNHGITMWRQGPPVPYSVLEEYLKIALGQAYNEN